MKTLKLFIAASLFFVATRVSACGPYDFSASDNRIYRIVSPMWSLPTTVYEDFETKNINLWSRQTGCKDTAEIRRAVYEGSLADWEGVYRYMKYGEAGQSGFAKNRFVQHLIKHNDIRAVEVLYGSKRYETIRNIQRSPWYYNSHIESDDKVGLRETYKLIDNARLNDKRYGDRFKFLAIKCAWALGDDASVLLMWERFQKSIKFMPLRYEAEDYVARTFERMGQRRLADSIYNSNCKFVELVPYNASTPTAMKILLQRVPNSLRLTYRLQEYISFLDREQASIWHYDEDTVVTDSVLAIARGAIANSKVRNKAQWRYAAACILDYKGKPKEALAMLNGAENAGGDEFLRNSVRVLRFYLRTKTATINDAFEQYALGEIKWMEKEMRREWKQMPNDTKAEIKGSDGSDWGMTIECNKLYYYSALRRIALGDSLDLTSRLCAAGRKVRALQIANMADNWILTMTDNQIVKHVRGSADSIYHVVYTSPDSGYCSSTIYARRDTASLPGHDFTIWAYYGNCHDYSDGLFELADEMDAKTLEAYRDRQLHPKDDIDRWMNAHSYTGKDYWEDIIGTHYMRERNYAAAVKHLKRVSPSYQRRMNMRLWLDPFAIDRNYVSHDSTHYKLHFAQQMDSLQNVMTHDANADRRGLAMLEYCIGLENSFGMCWWVTSYQKGWNGADLKDIEDTKNGKAALSEAKRLREKAFSMLQTDEARAKYHARIGHYTLVKRDYAHTQTGRFYTLICDGSWMYRPCRLLNRSPYSPQYAAN